MILASRVDVQRLAVLLELLQVQRVAAEAGRSHVSWLVSHRLLGNSAGTLLDVSLVEGLRLVELLSILSSVLIRVEVPLSRPAGTVPQGRVHRVARAVVEQRLSRSVEILLVLHVLVEFASHFSGEFTGGIAIPEH